MGGWKVMSQSTEGGHKRRLNFDGGPSAEVVKVNRTPGLHPLISERAAGSVFFCATVAILLGKLFIAIRPHFEWKKLTKTEWISASTGQLVMSYEWRTGIYGSYLFWPIVCGLTLTAFSWGIIYMDSAVPGIDPPTPFSPSKHRRHSRVQQSHWANIHIGYAMAVVSGITVFVLMAASNWISA